MIWNVFADQIESATRNVKKRKTKKGKRSASKRKDKVREERGSDRLSMLGSSKLEPTLSFSLFGKKYDLDEFCEDPVETNQNGQDIQQEK